MLPVVFAVACILAVHGELSPLERAVRWGDAKSVQKLQKLLATAAGDLGYSYDAEDGFGRSPLHEAVEFGHKKVVEEILAWQGSNQLVSAPDELGWTALHWAALKGSEDIARRLLDAKAKVDAKENEFGCEPLQWAARRGHLQLIRLLLKHGAVASHQDRENRTAAKWAHLTNHLSAFALLEGVELRSEGSEDEEALDETYNMSRLHAAVAKNNISEMKRLLRSSEAKDLLVKVDKWGRTPLVPALQASHKATGPGSEKLVMHFIRLMKMLRLEGTKGVFRPDKDRRDPVHWAALAGHRQVVLELSHMIPSDTPASDRWGNRLFHHAAANGHTSMMEWLLDQRAIVDGISSSKQTPLHMAAAGGHLDVTKLLLRRGSPLNAQDRLLRTPLHYAILQANSEIAEVLMKAGADASEADIDGMSPLSFAETALGLLKSVEME